MAYNIRRLLGAAAAGALLMAPSIASATDLEVIHWKGPDGTLKAGLARRDSTSIVLTHRKDGTAHYRRAGSHGGEILYIFKKSVNQAGDSTILPPMADLATAAREALEDFVGQN